MFQFVGGSLITAVSPIVPVPEKGTSPTSRLNDYCRAAIFKMFTSRLSTGTPLSRYKRRSSSGQSAVRRNRRMAKRASFLICCTAPTAVTSCGIMSTLSIKIYAFSPVSNYVKDYRGSLPDPALCAGGRYRAGGKTGATTNGAISVGRRANVRRPSGTQVQPGNRRGKEAP